MGTSSGPQGWHNKFHLLVAVGVENAMAKGWLFGRRMKNRREVIESRGAVIWPGPPDPAVWGRPRPAPHIAVRHRAEVAAQLAHRASGAVEPWRQADALPVSN